MSADKYSVTKFVEFCDYLGEKNLMAPETARARKVSALKILDVLDPAEQQDLRSLDRELVFHRFQNRAANMYSPSSLSVYRSRFNAAVDDFLRFAENPSAFRPNFLKSTVTTKNDAVPSKKLAKSNKKRAVQAAPTSPELGGNPLGTVAQESLTLPIPIRPGVVVKIFGLPYDLSDDEARKINAIIGGYAIGR